MFALTLEHLTKTYTGGKQPPVTALDDVSFTIEKGEFFGLLGPNGAGKSTLISILAGVVQKTGGKATIGGIDIDESHEEAKRKLGVVPQEITFDAFFSVETALEFQFGYYGLPVDRAYMDEILERLSLKDKRKVKPRMLSGGMKRRFMIAKALVHKPEILILDEPTAGVDVELRHDLHAFVRELNQSGTTVILTSHYLEEVELLCERIAIIRKGNLIALDNKEELKDRFQSTRQLSLALTKKLNRIPKELARFAPEQKESELRLTFEEGEYADVLRAVANVDLPIAHFEVIEPTLEDVFVGLTKEDV